MLTNQLILAILPNKHGEYKNTVFPVECNFLLMHQRIWRSSMHRVKNIQLGLSAAEVQEVLSIVLDQDRDKALDFMQNVLGKKVEKRLQEH
jgi:hypothetical protein